MSSAHRLEPSEEEARPQLTGTWSLMMGSAAVAAIGCPLLPESVPYQLRFLPVYFVLPLGVWAVASGIIALRRTGGTREPAVTGRGPGSPSARWPR
ncbi:hypothetical protein P1S61_15875 [Streptomyces sp. ME08-AFT2]|uniref:hypothetical protein n=1 Tax=Streptomyces sp. ME08-AFT2 TaxID=3028683 RepID=UPI0029ACEE8E|nr:hypothetical protein [Streptomyces sp. ME08-AFT2]MDX3310543.1 hypothetical protein [Streptomyces sp. ME08-AFT2]